MTKLKLFLLFLPLAIGAAAIFGAIDDQISYTVSNEYFTKFKFLQFGLVDLELPERLRASVVGVLASWWMGIPLGILCGAAGFMQNSPENMHRALLLSIPLIVMFTLAIALGGLAYGYSQTGAINMAAYSGWFIPPDLAEPRRFLSAGYMHNAAYLGGALSIPLAWLFHLGFRWWSA